MPLTNSQYDEIMRKYEKRRLKAEMEADRRRKDLCREEPRFAELDRRIASASVSRAKGYIAGDSQALRGLDEEIAAISAQRAEILKDQGLPADYLEPAYTCPDCRDTGYVNGQKCHCLRQAEADYLYAQSNLHEVLDRENFSTFSLRWYSADQIDPESGMSSAALAKSAVAKCRKMVAEFDRRPESLLFYGSTGTGKTFLTNCVARELLDAGHSVIYFSAFRFFEILSDRRFGRSRETDDYRNIYSCDLLIIDDLGTEVPNAVTVSQLFQCLNERILRGKAMIISTNLSLRELSETYSERISSRLTENFIPVRLYGGDIRILKKLNGI